MTIFIVTISPKLGCFLIDTTYISRYHESMAKNETPVQEKQYYVLVSDKSKGWKKGDIISITADEAKSYLGPKIITPLRTALNTGKYTPDIEIATYVRPKPVLRSSTNVEPEEVPDEEPKKKTLVKNKLRAAVQAKKTPPVEESTEPTLKPSEAKEQEKPTTKDTRESSGSSAAEDAIKAKIAAAKKAKK